MKNFIVVIPALKGDHSRIATKLISLSQGMGFGCHLFIHADSPALQRSYFYGRNRLKDVEVEFYAAVERWTTALETALDKARGSCRITTLRQREIVTEIATELREAPESWLVVFNTEENVADQYKAIMRKASNPVLVLSDKLWHPKPKLVAAVDPLHGHDRPQTIDQLIIERSKQVVKSLDGSLQIVHCCYVPPYLLKCQREIRDIHSERFSEFIAVHRLNGYQQVMTHGNPMYALHSYARQHGCDLLVLGSVARGYLERLLIGSTTEYLLSSPPCDLLLVRPELTSDD